MVPPQSRVLAAGSARGKSWRSDYFTTTVQDQPGEAYKLLSQLADLELNLVAFTAVPVGPCAPS